MNTTVLENDKFVKDVLEADYFLENCIDWITRNLRPDDVFDELDLADWARKNDYIQLKEED